jgi:hypothetical protein
MVKDEVDKLLEFLFSPDKEIVELYAKILFNKYDYDTIEECAFNHKPNRIIIYKLKDVYHMFSNNNTKGNFEIVYNPIKKLLLVK